MPLLFLLIGIALVVSAVLNTQAQLGKLLAADGPAFLPWAGAIVVIGAIGYIPEARTISRSLLVLVLIVIMLKDNGGFFAKFAEGIKNPAPATGDTLPTLSGPLPVTIGGSSGVTGATTATSALKLLPEASALL